MLDANNSSLPFVNTPSIAPQRTMMGAAAVVADYTGTEGPDAISGVSGVIEALGGNDVVYGSGSSDTVYGGSGDDYISGNVGDDALYGGDDNDTLMGGNGADTISGDGGDDDLQGSGEDSMDGGAGNDTLYGSINDSLDGGDGDDTLFIGNAVEARGGAGDDAIYTTARAKAILHVAGGEGRDTYHLAAGAGVVTIEDFVAGAGGDRINLDALLGATPKYVGGNPFELSLSQAFFHFDGEYLMWDADGPLGAASIAVARLAGVDRSTLTNDNFFSSAFPHGIWPDGRPDGLLLTGTAGSDSLTGGVGFDTLVGGAGVDTLVGGKGNDRYEINVAQDVVRELAGEGTDTVNVAYTAAGSYKLTANMENATVTAAAGVAVNLEGNDLDNQLTGNAAANALIGGAGNDTLNGGAGNDTMTGGAGHDTYVVDAVGDVVVEAANGGSDSVETSLASYTLGANVESLTHIGGGAFTGRGNAANNSLSAGDATGALLDGGAGNDAFSGSDGNDTLLGGDGDDGFSATTGSDVIDGGAGNDSIFLLAELSSYTISRSGPNTLVLTSIDSGETLTVSNVEYMSFAGIGKTPEQLLSKLLTESNDNYSGTDGDDTIDGLGGVDTLNGGAGDDTYVVDVAGDQVVELAGGGVDTVQVAFAGAGSYTLAANVENLLVTGNGVIKATGNALDNVMAGNGGGAVLDGLAGNDLLKGGNGNDSLAGGAGDDTMQAQLGHDTVDGGAGSDSVQLAKDFADYTITRTSATDTVLADADGNVMTLRGVEKVIYDGTIKTLAELQDGLPIAGTDGNDKLSGSAGADSMAGGLGDDTYVVNHLADAVLEDADAGTDLVEVALAAAGTYTLADHVENATVTAAATLAVNLVGNNLANVLTGSAAINSLDGGVGDDTLDGGAGNDVLIGGDGDDSLIGGVGADKMTGGKGGDIYVVDNAGDTVVELAGGGADWVQTSLATYTLGANVESLSYTGTGAFKGTGNELDNYLAGGNGGATLDGGAGNDNISGGKGNDSILGGDGIDMIVGGAGKDTVDGGAGNDTVMLTQNYASYTIKRVTNTDTQLSDASGNTLIVRNVETVSFADGVRSMSAIWGNTPTPLNDSLAGTSGDDSLDGGVGADTLAGGDGKDIYVVDNIGDAVIENADAGQDLVQVKLTAAGTYVLADNVEDATVTAAASIAANITGNALDNVLTGNAAANTLLGGAGNDTLIGGAGNDKLGGGTGNDEYLVTDAGDVVTELAGEGADTVKTTLATLALAANVEKLVYTGAVAFTGTGNALDNVIDGGSGGAKLDGGAGNDSLTGGSGADSLVGGLGDDTLDGVSGKDTIDGGVGNDVLKGLGDFTSYTVTRPNATDTVLTDAGGNVLTVRGVESFQFADGTLTLAEVQDNVGSIGNDNLHGTAGNDRLDGGLGVDTLAGGAGDDTYVIANGASSVLEESGGGADLVEVALTAAGSYVLAANVENATVTAAASLAVNLTGNELANKLTGNAAANTLLGGAGNDTLDGGAGADKLSGGVGNDTYVVADAGDVVTELAGEGAMDVVKTTLAAYALTANVERLNYTGSGAFTGTGNADSNIINGGRGAGGNKLDGGAGNDLLVGGAGNDSLQGGLGDDTLVAFEGQDTVDGGVGVNALQGLLKWSDYTVTRPTTTDTVLTDTLGNVVTFRNIQTFLFSDGEKTLAEVQSNIASAGNDQLSGGAGNDVLNGGLGIDTLTGGDGHDTYIVANAASSVVEGVDGGHDLVQVALTAAGTYVLAANVEDATVTAAAIAVNLTGNELNNYLTGNAAVNTLLGGAGNDTLDGGAGADKLNGGGGDDTYLVDVAGDVVTELAGEGTDTVKTTTATYTLTANVENLSYAGTAAFTGVGNALDNVIVGGDKGNQLDGGAGNDSLSGGSGVDSLVGGLGNDTFAGVGALDTIDGGDGVDLLQGLGDFAGYTVTRVNATETKLTDAGGKAIVVRNVEHFVFNGVGKTLAEVHYNVASAFNDNLVGGAGKDSINGGLGADTMSGGLGDDIYVVDNAGDSVVENLGEGRDLVEIALTAAATYTLGVNVEDATVKSAAGVAINVTGNDLKNHLIGNAAANTLLGGGGNDTLEGGAGNDTMKGGLGHDTYIVNEVGDVVVEAADEGVDTVLTTLSTYTMGANIDQLVYTGSGAFTGIGNGEADLMNGGNGGAKLDGGANNDFLIGGNGADSLQGGTGDDSFGLSAGKDTIDGGADADDLQWLTNRADYTVTRVNATDIVLTDAAGNATTVRNVELFKFEDGDKTLDELIYNVASSGGDKLYGGAGNDVLNGLAGADTLAGGAGDDSYVVDNAADVVVELSAEGHDTVQAAFTAAGTYTLAANVDDAVVTAAAGIAVNLTGNELDNHLTGSAAANILTGGAGDDTLDGGAGADKLSGGEGADVYLVDASGDVVTELADQGRDDVRTTLATYTLGANLENLAYSGKAAFTGTGNLLDNDILGGNFGNKLDGGAGNDTLTGGAGNDSLQGGAGDDALSITGGKDTIDGGAGNDVLQGLGNFASYKITRASATDTVLTDAAGNVTTARNVELFDFADGARSLAYTHANIVTSGNDVLIGTDGTDYLSGGAGADTMIGLFGDDGYTVDNFGDVVVEDADGGIDSVTLFMSAAGTYVLGENVEHAIVNWSPALAVNLTGNALDNQLVGNGGSNLLLGAGGNDTLSGEGGKDTLAGGAGDDRYEIEQGAVISELAGEGTDTVVVQFEDGFNSYTLADNVENLLFVNAGVYGVLTGIGNGGDNNLNAVSNGQQRGASILDGRGGNDTLTGGGGNDSLLGGDGDDLFGFIGFGADTIDGGAGNDTVTGYAALSEYTVLRGGESEVRLINSQGTITTVRNVESFIFGGVETSLAELIKDIGGTGSDTVTGTDGNDVLDGGPGADQLIGGLGDDTYVLSEPGDQVVEAADGGNDTVKLAMTTAATYVMAANVEYAEILTDAAIDITGNDLGNVIFGNAAANRLIGGAGGDLLDGGAGNDTMAGGMGDDSYQVGESGDVVVELAGEGIDTVYTKLSGYVLGANIEDLRYSGGGAFVAGGNALDNGFFAEAATSAVIDGGAGVDSVHLGLNFSDYTVSYAGGVTSLTHNGQVTALRNIEYVWFADGPALSLAEVLHNIATDGAEELTGTAGNDTLNGGLGADTLSGGEGNDVYVLNSSDDVVSESVDEGHDLVNVGFAAAGTYALTDNVEDAAVVSTAAVNLTGNALDNVLTGNAAANILTGGDGNDTLIGGAGNDSLVGGNEQDYLDGGAGSDTMQGGADNNTYVVDVVGDKIIDGHTDDTDNVLTSLASYTLAADLSNLKYSGTAAFTGTGNAVANLIEGGAGNDVLKGLAGNDTLIGGAGNDQLTGGADADVFVLTSLTGSDTIADFLSGTDLLKVLLPVGNGDSAIDGGLVRASAGGFTTDAELVLFTQKMVTATTANAAAVIGSAAGNYEVGDTALFAVSTAGATVLYRFQAANADAVVSAGELTQLVTLTGTPTTALGDYTLADYIP